MGRDRDHRGSGDPARLVPAGSGMTLSETALSAAYAEAHSALDIVGVPESTVDAIRLLYDAARSQPATEGLREAARARPKNGERIYVEEDDFVSGWGAAMDFIRAALAASEPDATGEGEKR
jgi:hypothetical protein